MVKSVIGQSLIILIGLIFVLGVTKNFTEVKELNSSKSTLVATGHHSRIRHHRGLLYYSLCAGKCEQIVCWKEVGSLSTCIEKQCDVDSNVAKSCAIQAACFSHFENLPECLQHRESTLVIADGDNLLSTVLVERNGILFYAHCVKQCASSISISLKNVGKFATCIQKECQVDFSKAVSCTKDVVSKKISFPQLPSCLSTQKRSEHIAIEEEVSTRTLAEISRERSYFYCISYCMRSIWIKEEELFAECIESWCHVEKVKAKTCTSSAIASRNVGELSKCLSK